MPEKELQAIEARNAARTPGTWKYEVTEGGLITVTMDARHDVMFFSECPQCFANMEFTAHASEDIPALLAEVRRLQKQVVMLAKVKGELCPMCDKHLSRYLDS